MKKIRFILVMVLSALAWSHASWGLEIPLAGATAGSDATRNGAIGYVDMDKIFQIYPQTQAAKEDYSKQLAKKRTLLAEKEAALTEIQSRAAVLESTLKQGAPPSAPLLARVLPKKSAR